MTKTTYGIGYSPKYLNNPDAFVAWMEFSSLSDAIDRARLWNGEVCGGYIVKRTVTEERIPIEDNP